MHLRVKCIVRGPRKLINGENARYIRTAKSDVLMKPDLAVEDKIVSWDCDLADCFISSLNIKKSLKTFFSKPSVIKFLCFFSFYTIKKLKYLLGLSVLVLKYFQPSLIFTERCLCTRKGYCNEKSFMTLTMIFFSLSCKI